MPFKTTTLQYLPRGCSVILWLWLLVLLTLSGPTLADTESTTGQHVVLNDERQRYSLGRHVDILRDASNQLDIEDIRQIGTDERFTPSKEDVPSFGFSNSTFWLRTQISNTNRREGNWILAINYAPIQNLDLFIERSDGRIEHQQSGTSRPFSERALNYRTPLFSVDLAPDEQVTLYLQVSSQSSVILPITLWQPEAFAEYVGEGLFAHGIYYGLIGALVLYNLFIFFTVRERSYLYYVLFLGLFAVYQLSLNGFAQQFFWPDGITWSNRPITLSASLAVLFGFLFTNQFLNIREHHPLLFKIGLIPLAVTLISLGLGIFASYRMAIMTVPLAGGLIVLYSILVGVVSIKSGYTPARYFVVAWLMLVIGTLLQALRAHGMVPSTFMTEHAIQIGSAMEAILLSLALAARIRTMKAQTETAQQATVDSMLRMDRLKDEFLANTSHELRTPINGMTGLAEAMLRDPQQPVTERQRQNLAMIVNSGQRLNSLVNDILDFSRLRHEDLVLAQKPVDVKALTSVVLELQRPMLRNKEIVLANAIADDLPPALADEARLQQILHNLIGNALKFTERGSVTVSAEQQQDTLLIHVTDTGIGISPEHQDNIFESFNQGDGSISREFGGTGLGLSITRQMVELHGGHIAVESTPGQGSAFTFTLPVCHDTPSPLSTAPASSQEVAGATMSPGPVIHTDNNTTDPGDTQSITPAATPVTPMSTPGKLERILVVDDEPINRQVLRSQLGGAGYTVEEAADGQQVLELFNQGENYDLILLDVMMPKLSGYDVCRELRKQWSTQQLPVIFLTARTQNEDVLAAFNSGANDYLSKPFSAGELQARVVLHLELARKYRDLAQSNAELKALTQANESLEVISSTDALTGLNNRRQFETRYQEEFRRAQRSGASLGLVILDIDHFKLFNDTHGHLVGDDCLKAVAQALRTTVTRADDLLCRFGGEEFVVLLPNATAEGALVVANRIRQAIEALDFQVDGVSLPVTVSLGVKVAIPDIHATPDQLLLQADEALYQAKNGGRNQVVVHSQGKD